MGISDILVFIFVGLPLLIVTFNFTVAVIALIITGIAAIFTQDRQ